MSSEQSFAHYNVVEKIGAIYGLLLAEAMEPAHEKGIVHVQNWHEEFRK